MVTSCKSVSYILVSPLVPNVVVVPISAVVNTLSSTIASAFSSILFDFF